MPALYGIDLLIQNRLALNETYRIISGCLKPTALNKLFPLAGIALPKMCRLIRCEIKKLLQKTELDICYGDITYPLGDLKVAAVFLRNTKVLVDQPTTARKKLSNETMPPLPSCLEI